MAEVNLTQLSEFYGKSRSSIQNWLAKGCPVIQRGTQGRQTIFDSVAVAEWLERQAINNAVGDVNLADVDELKKQKLAAETSLSQIEVAKAKGEVVYIEDAVKTVTDDILAAKARLRNVGARATPQVIGITDENKIQEIIDLEVDYALAELQNRFIGVAEDSENETE